MPVKDKRKLYNAVKKQIDGKDCFVVKFKNLSKQDIREVRTELNALLKDFWAPLEEDKDEDVVKM